jgi:site-specific recombinase XerD
MSSHRKAYSTRTLQYTFKRSIKEAGLPRYYSIHACRHSYGTYLYQKTKDLRLVQKQLGHSSITTTTVYADVTVQETLDAVNGLFEEDDRETDKTDTADPSDPNTTTKPEKSNN